MPRPLRLALVGLGLALAVYGTSTLTGGWLGMASWWVVRGPRVSMDLYSDGGCVRREWDEDPCHEPRAWDAPVGGAVIAVGLGLTAWGAWRRPRGPAVAAGADST